MRYYCFFIAALTMMVFIDSGIYSFAATECGQVHNSAIEEWEGLQKEYSRLISIREEMVQLRERALTQRQEALANGDSAQAQKDTDIAEETEKNISILDQKTLALKEKASTYCKQVQEQIARDQEALRRQKAVIEQGQRELEEWSKKNTEAQFNALQKSLNLLVNGILGYCVETENVINGLKGAIVKYERQLKRQSQKVDFFQYTKLESMNKRLLGLQSAADAAKKLQKTKEQFELAWNIFTATTRKADDEIASLQTDIQVLLDDPIFNDFVVKGGLERLSKLLKTKALFPKKPYLIDFVSFLVDYGYDATDWITSRNRIIQQYELTDTHLKAVESLKKQIECTMEQWNSCRQNPLVSTQQ